MTDKVYRIHFSEKLDQESIQFLDSIKSSRRSEVTRYIIRYYMSFLDSETPEFLPIQTSTPIEQRGEESLKEFKVRLDPLIDKPLINLIEQVPRRRRSEFIRHIFQYYLSHLPDGEWVIFPSYQNKAIEKGTIYKEEDESTGELPGDELSGLSF